MLKKKKTIEQIKLSSQDILFHYFGICMVVGIVYIKAYFHNMYMYLLMKDKCNISHWLFGPLKHGLNSVV